MNFTFQNIVRHNQKLVLAVVLLAGCASSSDVKVEEAQFLLDKRMFTEAAVVAREAVAADPTNGRAKFTLASALIGVSVLGDESYLSKLANMIDAVNASGGAAGFTVVIEDDFTLARLVLLWEARDTLLDIPESSRTRDVYLQLYMSRLFNIGATNWIIGVRRHVAGTDPNNVVTFDSCKGPAFDATVLDSEEATRYREDLDNIDDDRFNAGLGDDFPLGSTLLTMDETLNDSISTAGDTEVGTENFLSDQTTSLPDCSL